jgi:hypothetical protein
MKNRLRAAAFAGIVFACFAFVAPHPEGSDFYAFWAAAKLAGPSLYDPVLGDAIQHAVSPAIEHKRYVRPPF